MGPDYLSGRLLEITVTLIVESTELVPVQNIEYRTIGEHCGHGEAHQWHDAEGLQVIATDHSTCIECAIKLAYLSLVRRVTGPNPYPTLTVTLTLTWCLTLGIRKY